MIIPCHKLMHRFLLAVLVAAAAGCSSTTSTSERTTLETQSRAALENLYRTTPAAKELAAKSAGVLVFPDVTQGGLIVGGQYGKGVLFEGGQPAGYYSVSGGSIGLQIGGQTFSQAYFFTTPAALKTFKDSKGFDVGAGMDLAVANVTASGQISAETLGKPLVIFVWGQQGLMAGVKVAGQKITKLTNE
jgi:lipid-binding SYLF domain-containing protein